MSNPTFDPDNPVYPPGCYGVPTPEFFPFREPNREPAPEMDFNKYIYFSPTGRRGALQIVSDSTIRDILRSPESPWDKKLEGLVMKGPSGDIVHAHLPNLVDTVGKMNLVEVLTILRDSNASYDKNEISQIVPTCLVNVLDPCPVVVVEGLVYPLVAREVKTEMGCYTDGIQIFYLHAKISEISVKVVSERYRIDPFFRHMDVTLEAKHEVGENTFALGSSVVLWNARGVTRPSFKSSAQKIVSVHKPIIFVITEVRVGRKNFEEVVNAFENGMSCILDKGVGQIGGVGIIWEKNKITSDLFLVTLEKACPLRLVGRMKAAVIEPGNGGKAAAIESGNGGETPAIFYPMA